MGRKVFISVLGISWYNECLYVGKNSGMKTKFIQLATLKEIGAKEWSENDVVYILVTKKAREENWHLVNDERKDRDGNIKSYPCLESGIAEMGLNCRVEAVDINDGQNIDEMWGIFSQVFALLKNGDELYFDFTHGFRYLPMFVLVLSSYAKYMKNVSIAYMSYGNFEFPGPEKPIMDLMSLATLQNWTSSAISFREMGRVTSLIESLASVIDSDKECFSSGTQNRIRELMGCLTRFVGQIETCRGQLIVKGEDALKINKLVNKITNGDAAMPDPLRRILLSIKDEVAGFKSDSMGNIIQALEWCKRYRLVQQGYTLCQEGLVTVACNKYAFENPYKDGRKQENDRNYRDFWATVFGIADNVSEADWKGRLAENPQLARRFFSMDWVKQIRLFYRALTTSRNQVNHGGFVDKATSQKIIGDFVTIVDRGIEMIRQGIGDAPSSVEAEPKPRIFLNVSNHPFVKWSEVQKKAAVEYGDLDEIAFPMVSPEIGEDRLASVVDECLKEIGGKISGKEATVHIMGEMTLTYALVQRLLASGVRCVASTTRRDVRELPDGRKESTFHFVRFREYACAFNSN